MTQDSQDIIAMQEMASKLSPEMIDLAIDILDYARRKKRHEENMQRLEAGETLEDVFFNNKKDD